MKMLKTALSALVAAVLAANPLPARAESDIPSSFMIRYDVDSTTETFCRMEGVNGNTTGALQGPARVKTSGSATTVVSDTASSGALTPLVHRDYIQIRRNTGLATPLPDPFDRGDAAIVTVKTDANTVTVDPAVDWSAGFAYDYFRTTCGTTDAHGAIDTSNSKKITMGILYSQGDLDALSWRFQCSRGTPGALWETVYPSEGDGCGAAGTLASGFCEFATAGATASFTWEEFGSWSKCRVGFKVKTTDTSEAGANLERVTASIIVSR